MVTRADLVDWVSDALEELGVAAGFVEVARHVWDRHEGELRGSGDLLYTWQNDLRRIAPSLDGADAEAESSFDVFISHSSADNTMATALEAGLESNGLRVWLDRSDLRRGGMLRAALQRGIRRSRTVLLLWSEASARSHWVATEWLMAYHVGKFIVPCRLDDTPFLEWLANVTWLEMRSVPDERVMKQVAREITDAPSRANEVEHFPRARSDADPFLPRIGEGQGEVLDAFDRNDFAAAAAKQAKIDPLIEAARSASPDDPLTMNYAAYHGKNAYLIEHHERVDVGRPPDDPRLWEAEELFLTALSVDPRDLNALNGLGSVLIYRGEFDAAELVVRRALEYARAQGVPYPAAEADLALLKRIKQQMIDGT